MPDDRDLMRSAQRGDRQAYGVLVQRWAAPLLGCVRALVRDYHVAEEIVQDALLQGWKARQQYDLERPFKPWLYRLAIHRCYEYARKYHAFDGVAGEPVSPQPAPLTTLLASEQEAHVRAAVEQLPFVQRAVVILRIWEEHSYGEIADILGLAESTARSHMHHALNQLRRTIDNENAERGGGNGERASGGR